MTSPNRETPENTRKRPRFGVIPGRKPSKLDFHVTILNENQLRRGM
jgi:hypothetical protein